MVEAGVSRSMRGNNLMVFVTGAAGFIGYHVSKRLLERGDDVVGIDNLNDYYDVSLKEARLALLQAYPKFRFRKIDVADADAMRAVFAELRPERVVHLAAQAGVRYSLKNPHAYTDSNITGFLNILEGCRHNGVEHLVFASSSSVYGANTKQPFSEHDNVDHPVSLYAATKKANELMAHSYAHLFGIPVDGTPLLHGVRPVGPAGHGALQLHARHSGGRAHSGLQQWQDDPRLHLHRRHRRRGRARSRQCRGARSGLERR